MQSIYWITFVVGGIFVVLAVIGGIDGADIEFAADLDFAEPDFDAEGGLDQDVEVVDRASVLARASRWQFNPFIVLLSLKFWTFGSCFFGLTGLLIGWIQPQRNPINVFIISLLMGLFIGSMVSLTFYRLRQRPSGMTSPDELVGVLATVELPIDKASRGKIRVQIQDGIRELHARTNDEKTLQVGDSVMIIGIEEDLVWVVSESSLKDSSI